MIEVFYCILCPGIKDTSYPARCTTVSHKKEKINKQNPTIPGDGTRFLKERKEEDLKFENMESMGGGKCGH